MSTPPAPDLVEARQLRLERDEARRQAHETTTALRVAARKYANGGPRAELRAALDAADAAMERAEQLTNKHYQVMRQLRGQLDDMVSQRSSQ